MSLSPWPGLTYYEVMTRPGEFTNLPDDFASLFYPELYTAWSVDGRAVTVHRVPTPGLPLDAALRERFPGLDIRFADSHRCRVELMALTHRIHRDHEEWRSRGIHITRWGPDLAGVVTVGIRQTTESAMEELRASYDEAVVVTGGMQPGVALPLGPRPREITPRRHSGS